MILELRDIVMFVVAVAMLVGLMVRARRGPPPAKFEGDLAQGRREIRGMFLAVAIGFILFPALYLWLVLGNDRSETAVGTAFGYSALTLGVVPVALILRAFIPRA